MGKELRF
jgi:hypothetical protein